MVLCISFYEWKEAAKSVEKSDDSLTSRIALQKIRENAIYRSQSFITL
jgi:hypothetical protein